MLRIVVISIVLLALFPATAVALESRVVCIRVTSAEAVADADLANAIAGGTALIQVVDDAECASGDAQLDDQQAAFSMFVSHLGEGLSAARAATEQFSSGDLGQQVGGLDAMRLWAVGELAWLDEHPPAFCYDALYAYWRKSVQKIKNGAQNAQAGSVELRFAKFRGGIRQATNGIERLDEIPTLLSDALAQCALTGGVTAE